MKGSGLFIRIRPKSRMFRAIEDNAPRNLIFLKQYKTPLLTDNNCVIKSTKEFFTREAWQGSRVPIQNL